ncbi:MAG: 16S rRNA (cytosine(967)-C(5))-methyltransferase RsmB [Acidaminococcaceae bacterium]|nr:16S rRNA (cytosine(967)-C(5))-methyltransferase RsmB [Acidaminococcaceae bacterium]MDO4935619.1 16S rRNA (cytosine(967)-C(5))-methyltransferase RsmB [Phascolarctobacterium sp.]
MNSTRETAVRLVEQVCNGGAYTNLLLSKYLRENNLTDLDRRFLTELVYGTVKAWGTLDWYLAKFVNQPLNKIEPLVLSDLRVAVFQILYLEKVPASAAVNEAVELAKKLANPGAAKLVNGVLRNFLRQQKEIEFPQNEAERIALTLWHPKDLVKKWLKYYGREETIALCNFNNSSAPLCLRVNTLKTTKEQLGVELEKLGVEFVFSKLAKDGIVCKKIPNLGMMLDKLAGQFYIQDESSMLVAELLAPQPGQKILDLCAAPGGKTTHITQIMNNQGSILACDIHSHKLPLIENNAQGLGISIIETKLHDATELNEEFIDSFDGVLVDAPCSGLGVLRRRAEARWKKTRDVIKVFPPLQSSILNNGAKYVKENGKLVYSTCTIEQSENHYVVAKFLEEHPNFKLVSERQLLPQRDGVDGFYMALLRRKGQGIGRKRISN